MSSVTVLHCYTGILWHNRQSIISSPPTAEIMLHFFLNIASFHQEQSCSYVYDANVEATSLFCPSFPSEKFPSFTQLQKQDFDASSKDNIKFLLSLDLYLINHTLSS